MAELPELVKDLALILVVAGAVTLIFKKLKQPLVSVSYTHLTLPTKLEV